MAKTAVGYLADYRPLCAIGGFEQDFAIEKIHDGLRVEVARDTFECGADVLPFAVDVDGVGAANDERCLIVDGGARSVGVRIGAGVGVLVFER